jgi:hypothetical protein
MSMNLATSLQVALSLVETLTVGLTSAPITDSVSPTYTLTAGTATGQNDLHWEQPATTLAAGASQTFVLSGLTDLLGRTVAFAKVRIFLIQITSRTAGDYLTLDVSSGVTHPVTSILGGTNPTEKVYDLCLKVAVQTDGFAIAIGSADQIKITNSGSNPITFVVALAGTHV